MADEEWETSLATSLVAVETRQPVTYRLTTTALGTAGGWAAAVLFHIEHTRIVTGDDSQVLTLALSSKDMRLLGEHCIKAADRADDEMASGTYELPEKPVKLENDE